MIHPTARSTYLSSKAIEIWRVPMRLILPTLAAILTLSGAVHAQNLGTPSAMGGPAMGATSPLGVPGTIAMTPAPSGIGLGATEINSSGLSPMPLATCPTVPSGTFDGGDPAGD